MLDFIVEILEENPLVTVSNLNKELRRRYPNKPEICDKTLSNAIDSLAFTLKLSRDTSAQRNSWDKSRPKTTSWMDDECGSRKFIKNLHWRIWMHHPHQTQFWPIKKRTTIISTGFDPIWQQRYRLRRYQLPPRFDALHRFTVRDEERHVLSVSYRSQCECNCLIWFKSRRPYAVRQCAESPQPGW